MTPQTDWWALSPEDATRAQSVDALQGLSATDVAARLAQHGLNRLPEAARRPAWLRLLLQFHNPLIYVLLAAGAVTAALEDYVDAGVIFGVVVINAIIGFIQEGKAERALEAVRDMLASRATVIRDGVRQEIDAAELVPGDVALLASGDRVPADLRLLEVKSLRAIEAALTGESAPVDKSAAAVAAQAPLGDRTCMAYSGTLIAYGQARGLVVGTGVATEIGRIGALVGEVQSLTTPLVRRLDRFATQIAAVILVLGAAAFLYGLYVVDMPALEVFLAVVGLIVGAIPEGLPAIVTIVLTIGARTMAQNRAIVRRLPAVETLGGVSVICTDKTGTLTKNEMTVVRALTPARDLTVAGVGYAPNGGFDHQGDGVDPSQDPALRELALCALLCNDAQLHPDPAGGWRMVGDPTEGALAALGRKAGLDPDHLAQLWPRLDALPFESERRYMATLHRDPSDPQSSASLLLIKGAPERILALCAQEADGAPVDHAAWTARMDAAASGGERVLALARRALTAPPVDLNESDVDVGGFTLLGMVGVIDPPREEAMAALRDCRNAGVQVKMITGDHALTAAAIGRQLGLTGERALTGAAIDALSDDQLLFEARAVDVFARAGPEHKLRIIKVLQADGQLVAMTGDGVNDAPALKAADIGVAMGGRGADAARESADLVLTDDNFATIAQAVRQGRVVYDNIAKSLLFLLPTNLAQGGVILLALLAGLLAPVTAGQILWINMVAAVTLALALAFEPAEAGVMRQPPRAPDAELISRVAAWRMLYVGLLLIAATFGLFEWSLARGDSVEVARTVALNILAVGQIGYLYAVRFGAATALRRDLFADNPVALGVSVLLIGLQALVTYAPPLQALFLTAPIDGTAWALIALVSVALFLAVEAEKALRRRGQQRP